MYPLVLVLGNMVPQEPFSCLLLFLFCMTAFHQHNAQTQCHFQNVHDDSQLYFITRYHWSLCCLSQTAYLISGTRWAEIVCNKYWGDKSQCLWGSPWPSFLVYLLGNCLALNHCLQLWCHTVSWKCALHTYINLSLRASTSTSVLSSNSATASIYLLEPSPIVLYFLNLTIKNLWSISIVVCSLSPNSSKLLSPNPYFPSFVFLLALLSSILIFSPSSPSLHNPPWTCSSLSWETPVPQTWLPLLSLEQSSSEQYPKVYTWFAGEWPQGIPALSAWMATRDSWILCLWMFRRESAQ